MDVVWNAVYDDGFVAFVGDDSWHIFKEVFFPGLTNQVGSAFYYADDVDVDFCISTCHIIVSPRWGLWGDGANLYGFLGNMGLLNVYLRL